MKQGRAARTRALVGEERNNSNMKLQQPVFPPTQGATEANKRCRTLIGILTFVKGPKTWCGNQKSLSIVHNTLWKQPPGYKFITVLSYNHQKHAETCPALKMPNNKVALHKIENWTPTAKKVQQ